MENKAHPLGQGGNNWQVETHTFSPRTQTVSCLVALGWLHDRLSLDIILLILIDIVFFAKCLKMLSMIINVCVPCTHHLYTRSLLCVYQNFDIALHNFEIRFLVLKLVRNYTISNLCSSISKLHKFANCVEHTYYT